MERGHLGAYDRLARSYRVLELGELHIDRRRAETHQHLDGGTPRAFDVWLQLRIEVGARNAEPKALHAKVQPAGEVFNWAVDRRRIAAIEAGHGIQHERRVMGATRHRPGVVQ